MNELIPHRNDVVVSEDGMATDIMRGWMERIGRIITPAVYSIGSSQTSKAGNGIYILTAAVTFTLGIPEDRDTLIIHRNYSGSNSTIDGGALDINGSGTYTMSTDRETITLIYLKEVGEWVIV